MSVNTLNHINNKILSLSSSLDEFKKTNDEKLNNLATQQNRTVLEKCKNLEDKFQSYAHKLEDFGINNLRPITNISKNTNMHNKNTLNNYLRKTVTNSMEKSNSLASGHGNIEDNYQSSIKENISQSILKQLHVINPIRKIASVSQISSSRMEIILDNTAYNTSWSGNAPVSKTGLEITKKAIQTYELQTKIVISNTLLEDYSFNLSDWVIENVSNQIAEAEHESFMTGDGDNKPNGLLKDASYRPNIKSVAMKGNSLIADDVINLFFSLDSKYISNATFLMHSSTLKFLRSIKDANLQPIWSPAMNNQPETILGKPIVTSSHMPMIGNKKDKNIILFGDFKKAYHIADRTDIQILKDPFSSNPNVIFHINKRVGATVIDTNAITQLNKVK